MLVEDSNFIAESSHTDVPPSSAASLTKLHCRQQYARNERLLNQRKIKSRNAARTRRGKENLEFYELAKLLPIPGELSSQLDKASIIRLAMSFLKVREFCYFNELRWKVSSDGPPPNRTVKDASSTACLSPQQVGVSKFLSSQEGSLILQSLDGFMLMLNCKGQLIYVSEAISVFLGLSQVEMIGSSIFDYVYPEDRNELAVHLGQALSEHRNDRERQNATKCEDSVDCLSIRMKSTLAKKGMCPKSSSFKVVRLSTRVQKSTCRSDVKRFTYVESKQGASADSKTLADSNLGIIAFGSTLPPDSLIDGRLCQNSIVTRVNAALQFTYCETQIHKLMGYEVRDVIGQSLYQCIHAADAQSLKKCHAELLLKGHVETPYFRWLHKSGGFRWAYASIMPMPNQRLYPEQSFILVHTIISDILGENQLMDVYQMPFGAVEQKKRTTQQLNDDSAGDCDNVVKKCISSKSVESLRSEQRAHQSSAEGLSQQEFKVCDHVEKASIHKSIEGVTLQEGNDMKDTSIASSESSDIEKTETEAKQGSDCLTDPLVIGDGEIGNNVAEISHESGISLLCVAQEWAHHFKQRSSLRYADFVSEYMDIDSNYWSNPPNKEVSNHNDLPPGAKKMHGLLPARHTPSVVHHHYPIGIAPSLLHTSPLVAKLVAAQWHGVHKLADARTLVVTTPVTMVPPFCLPNIVNPEKMCDGAGHTPASVAATLEELKKDPLHKLNPPNKVVLPGLRDQESKPQTTSGCKHPVHSSPSSTSPCQGSDGSTSDTLISGTETRTKQLPALNLCSQHILKQRVPGPTVFQVPSTVLVPATGILANGAESTVITLAPNSGLQFPLATETVQEHLAPCIVQPFAFSPAAVRSVPF